MDAMVQVRDKAGNRPLKVDVVLPERVVGIDQQGLVRRTGEIIVGAWAGGDHRLIISRLPAAWLPAAEWSCNGWGMSASRGNVTDWKTMMTKEKARLDRPSGRKTTHDRRSAADIGFKVWNTFEAELRVDAGGRRESASKARTRVIERFER
jgi:hypothetical protein